MARIFSFFQGTGTTGDRPFIFPTYYEFLTGFFWGPTLQAGVDVGFLFAINADGASHFPTKIKSNFNAQVVDDMPDHARLTTSFGSMTWPQLEEAATVYMTMTGQYISGNNDYFVYRYNWSGAQSGSPKDSVTYTMKWRASGISGNKDYALLTTPFTGQQTGTNIDHCVVGTTIYGDFIPPNRDVASINIAFTAISYKTIGTGAIIPMGDNANINVSFTTIYYDTSFG